MLLRALAATWISVILIVGAPANAETPEQWVKLLTRIHGGFGSFLPVGIQIGEDAMKRLNAKPRELTVTFYQGEGTPCPCAADGVMVAVYASPGQRKGGVGLKYTVPMSVMPKLDEVNRTIQDPLARYNAVMAIPDLFTVEAAN